MPRAALYARFSTDLQSERSVEDQFALCRDYCVRENLTVVGRYEDRAKSGASVFGRDGLLSLMAEARRQLFDVVVVEHSDRLSRSMKDFASIHETLTFLGIELRAVHSGKLDTATIGLFDLVGQLQREDGAKKVRRGMTGVVRDGRYAGGRPYGYRVVAGEKGRLAVVEEEAAVVRRIFDEYASGRAPREISGDLNREGIAPPRGRLWNASTINGNAQRGKGIIFNEVYVGRLVWNKVRMVKDPETGKRVSRPNAPGDHVSIDAPELRILHDATWSTVRDRKAARTNVLSHLKRRPAHALSGLMRCGVCGSGMSVHDRDKTGRTRQRCSAVRESGTCTNTARIYLERVENAVVEGMAEQLRDPRLIETYVRSYNQERQALASASSRNRAKLEVRLADAQRELDRTIDNLIKGRLSEEEADERLPPLRAERDRLRAELAAADEAPRIISLHPAAIRRYLDTVDQLAAALAAHANAEDDRGKLIKEFRALVHSVTVSPRGKGKSYDVEVKGKLAHLIGGEAFPEKVGRRMVAEEGLEPPTRGL